MAQQFIVMNLFLLVIAPMLSVREHGLHTQSLLPKPIQTASPYFDTKTVLATAPDFFSRSAIPGYATFEVEINNAGTVVASTFVGGHPLLMVVTKAAVRQWKFEPMAERAETRKVQLRFFYDESAQVKISPYEITLDVKYECPGKAEIERAEASQYFSIATGHCEVHKRPLQIESVRIIYGLMGYRKGFWAAQEKHFPHANFFIDGGCVIMTRQYGKCEIPPPQFGEVSYCQRCREASAKWNRQHKHVKFE